MPALEARISVITLGVQDFPRSLHFYRDILGWRTSATEADPVAFFPLRGMVLSLYGRKELALDAKTPPEGQGFHGFTVSHNVGSSAEVDQVFDRLKAAGCTIVKEPQSADWGGYSGYFSDPDGNLWEVAYNPSWKLHRDGSVTLE